MQRHTETRGRILHCIPGMGGGGAERQLTYLARELVRDGWETHVALRREGPNMARLQASGAHVHMLHASANHDPRLFLQVRSLLRRLRPDIVQTWIRQMDILGGIAALSAGVPWVFSERSSAQAYPPTLKHRARSVLAARASAIVSNSSGGDAYWDTRVPPGLPRFTVPNAVPLDEIACAPVATAAQTGIPDNTPLILFIGRFSHEKNLPGLINALRSVLEQTNAAAVLCGDGPLRSEIERLADGVLPAGRVRFAGYVTDVWPWLKRADALVSVGFFEGNPNAVIEAMACGCPLVVSDIPAHREILDESTAAFASPHSVDAIVSALVTTITDRSAARARAGAAQQHAARWDTHVIARAYEDVYEQLLSQPVVAPQREAVA